MSARPRVALVAHVVHPAGGGMAAMNASYVAALSSRFAFTIVAAEVDEASARHAERVVPVPTPSSPAALRFAVFYLLASWRMRSLRREVDLVWTTGAICAGRVDLMSVHLCQAGLVEAYGGRLTAPGLRGPRRLAAGAHRLLALRAERRAAGRTRAFAAVSGSLAAELQRHYPGVGVRPTPNGADLDELADVPARPAAAERLVVGFIGGDWPLRRLEDLLEGLAGALAQGAAVELLVAGRGDAAWLSGRVATLGLEAAVAYLGEVDGPRDLLAACDLLAVPSPYETFSLVALEAAAAGRAVVGRAVGIVPELVGEAARPGGVVVAGDPASFTEALVALAADRPRLLAMGEAARTHAQAFSSSSASAAMEAALVGLLR